MKAFFDNCTSPVLASTLNGYLQHAGDAAVHIRDLPCGRNAPDIEWMSFLAATKEDWLVFTGDLRIQRNPAERRAYRQAGLKGIALAPAYQTFPVHRQASLLLWRWNDIEAFVGLTAAPFLIEIPVQRNARLRVLTI